MSEGTPPPAYALWDRVQREMARRGWGKTRLHQETKLSRATIDGLSKGRTPTVRTVTRLAEVLGIPVEEAHRLAGLFENPDRERPETGDLDDSEIRNLISSLPEGRRRTLEKILEDERERLERLTQQARADYERARRRVAEMAWQEMDDRNPESD